MSVRGCTFAQPVSQSNAGPDLNRQTHYGFRRIRSEMRGSEGKVVESLVDHVRTHLGKKTRPHWSTGEESPCKLGFVPTLGLSEAQPWMKWNRLLDRPRRNTAWLPQFQDYRLPSRRLCNNPSCHACCTRRPRNAEAPRQTCYLPTLAKGLRMQAAASCLRHSIQN